MPGAGRGHLGEPVEGHVAGLVDQHQQRRREPAAAHLPLVGLRLEVRQQPGEDRGEPLVVVVGHQQVQGVGLGCRPGRCPSASRGRPTRPGRRRSRSVAATTFGSSHGVTHRVRGRRTPTALHLRVGLVPDRRRDAGSPPSAALVGVGVVDTRRSRISPGGQRRPRRAGHRHVEHPLGDVAHRPVRRSSAAAPSSPVNSILPCVVQKSMPPSTPACGCPRRQRLAGLLRPGRGVRVAQRRPAGQLVGAIVTCRVDRCARRNPPGSNTRTSPSSRRRAMVVSIRSRLTDSRIAGPTQSNTPGSAHSAVLPERVGPTIATDVTSPGRPWRTSPGRPRPQPGPARSWGSGAHRWLSVATSQRPHVPSTNRPGTGRRTSSGRSSRRVANRAWASTPRRRRRDASTAPATAPGRPRPATPPATAATTPSPPSRRRRPGSATGRPTCPAHAAAGSPGRSDESGDAPYPVGEPARRRPARSAALTAPRRPTPAAPTPAAAANANRTRPSIGLRPAEAGGWLSLIAAHTAPGGTRFRSRFPSGPGMDRPFRSRSAASSQLKDLVDVFSGMANRRSDRGRVGRRRSGQLALLRCEAGTKPGTQSRIVARIDRCEEPQ